MVVEEERGGGMPVATQGQKSVRVIAERRREDHGSECRGGKADEGMGGDGAATSTRSRVAIQEEVRWKYVGKCKRQAMREGGAK
jgi:hypothetical protein